MYLYHITNRGGEVMRKYLCICIILLIGLTGCSTELPSDEDVALKEGVVNVYTRV